jgi:hypothetical protein
MIHDYEEPWWNDTDRKTKELGEKPVPVPLCPPHMPHGLIWAFAVRGQQLTA